MLYASPQNASVHFAPQSWQLEIGRSVDAPIQILVWIGDSARVRCQKPQRGAAVSSVYANVSQVQPPIEQTIESGDILLVAGVWEMHVHLEQPSNPSLNLKQGGLLVQLG